MPGSNTMASVNHSVSHSELAPPPTLAAIQAG
jgi:hypothetical protein